MGRYYTGDIEGKFWFAVQRSNDADFFGVTGVPPQDTLNYNFEEQDFPKVIEGITECLIKLGDIKYQLDEFFKDHNAYNDEMVGKAMGIPEMDAMIAVKWYARLELGEKIRDCIKEKGYCSFNAEL